MGTSQIPNYLNFPSQLMCQVHNVTLHTDRDEKSQLMVGANRQQTTLPSSSVLLSSHHSMHNIGVLAAAAANRIPFTISLN